MPTAAPEVVAAYSLVLERAILDLRCRIRYQREVTLKEVHGLLDALEYVPTMLRRYGNWHVEENIDFGLSRYDKKWAGKDHRLSLMKVLQDARQGES